MITVAKNLFIPILWAILCAKLGLLSLAFGGKHALKAPSQQQAAKVCSMLRLSALVKSTAPHSASSKLFEPKLDILEKVQEMQK